MSLDAAEDKGVWRAIEVKGGGTVGVVKGETGLCSDMNGF